MSFGLAHCMCQQSIKQGGRLLKVKSQKPLNLKTNSSISLRTKNIGAGAVNYFHNLVFTQKKRSITSWSNQSLLRDKKSKAQALHKASTFKAKKVFFVWTIRTNRTVDTRLPFDRLLVRHTHANPTLDSEAMRTEKF